MKIKIAFIFLSVLLFSTLIIGCSTANQSSNETYIENFSSASWVDGYKTVKEMGKSADLIVIGEVVDQVTETRGQSMPMVFTNQIIKIKDISKDKRSSKFANLSEIKVKQTGGELNGLSTQSIDGVEFLEKGTEYLLFLKETNEEHFLVMGGVQGAYRISNDTISVSESNKKSNILSDGFNGKSVKDALKEIKEDLKKSDE